MPKMQVTFTNVVLGAQRVKPTGVQHISMIFQIDFRGKSYNCVAHLKQFLEKPIDQSRIQFTGYYGYNGPIDIESLRRAVIDYYESAIENQETKPRRVKIGFDDPITSQPENPIPATTKPGYQVSKSYEFNVGKFHYGEWKEAS